MHRDGPCAYLILGSPDLEFQVSLAGMLERSGGGARCLSFRAGVIRVNGQRRPVGIFIGELGDHGFPKDLGRDERGDRLLQLRAGGEMHKDPVAFFHDPDLGIVPRQHERVRFLGIGSGAVVIHVAARLHRVLPRIVTRMLL